MTSAVPLLFEDPGRLLPPMPLEKVLASNGDGDSTEGVGERPRPMWRGGDGLEDSSESEISEESSSPEGDTLLAGFDRNQLNQPNPELFVFSFPSPGFPLCEASW